MRMTLLCLFLFLQTSAIGIQPPAALLDLSNWRLTLPVDTERSGVPDEVEQPELQSFQDPSSFFVDADGGGVVFRAHCGGITTKGSSYPRCELREMTDDGTKHASWGTAGNSVHTMTMRVAITATPPVKRHVVCAQIHDAQDDVLMVRLEGKKLFIERNAEPDVMLDKDHRLGTPFDLKIQSGEGTVRVWYNGELKMSWDVLKRGCYFKAGCYTQSNPSKGDEESAFGEVVIYQLQVEQR